MVIFSIILIGFFLEFVANKSGVFNALKYLKPQIYRNNRLSLPAID